MKLQHLRTSKCPECSCKTVIQEEIKSFAGAIRIHCNGNHGEKRTFICGKIIEYVPALKRDEEISECRLTKKYLARQRKKEKIKRQIIQLSKELRLL